MMFVFITCILMAAAGIAPVMSDQGNILTKSNGLFSAQLYNAVNTGNGNLLVSPMSLNYAMTAVSLGANNNTLKQIRSALNQPSDKTAIISSYRVYTDSLKNNKILTTATKMFVDNHFKIKDQFKNELTVDFDAEVDNIDFSQNPEQSRVVINNYVDNKTNHLIPELFGKGTINADTPAVLVNAVHFKADWEHAFKKENTIKDKFYGLDKEHEVDMMYLGGNSFNYLYSSELEAEIIELPYKGGYTFVVILPKEKKGITKLENKIKNRSNNADASPFIDMLKGAQKVAVDVHLPKFTFEQTHDLVDSLQKLGITEAFTKEADFKNMSDEPLKIDRVIQKTFIRVDEKGTEAAAATGLQFVTFSFATPKNYVFRADHPFIYLIKDKSSQSPLFVGRFSKA